VQDEEEAVKLYMQAAAPGYALAQFALGLCCVQGKGCVQDGEAAAKLFTQAAD